MPFAAPQAGAVASAGGPCSRRTQQSGLQQPYRCPTVAAASRRRPSQLVRMMRQQPAARAASGASGPGADAEAFGSVDYVEAGETVPAAAPAVPAAAAAASPSGIDGPAAAALQPTGAAPRPPPSMRSEDVALGILIGSEEEEEEEEAEGAEQNEVDSLKQEVSELRQLLIAQVGAGRVLLGWLARFGLGAAMPRAHSVFACRHCRFQATAPLPPVSPPFLVSRCGSTACRHGWCRRSSA